ncbi:MAG: hypothetical protein B6245_04185 [Desulfobacteraceae bacterium 4572_88]|nr:MAG: hypothetical protein B6245_04185 [Desulfobacteraceae bacterium 4572_88]
MIRIRRPIIGRGIRTSIASSSGASDERDDLRSEVSKTSEVFFFAAFLSLGGFRKDALRLCQDMGIGTAERIEHF